jgi:phosphoglycerate kinase
LRPVAEELGGLLDREVAFSPDPASGEAVAASQRLRPGDVLVVENTRFNPGETKNDPEFAKALSRLGDVYVNDAFGTAHRAHASTAGVARYLKPAAAGLLMERELDYLGHLLDNPERPFVTLLGGAKVSSKIEFIENLLGKVDRLGVGGAMACTFIKAMGFSVGRSLVEDDYIEFASRLIKEAGEALLLPVDVVVTDKLEQGATSKRVERDAILDDAMVTDIGPRSAAAFAEQVRTAKTILWNGPLGVFEIPPFDEGTRMIATAVAAATGAGATSVVGGGDTAAAVAAFGLTQHMTHISTGGGASLELLAGKELPGVAALTDRLS